MSEQIPTIGRIVLYKLSQKDVEAISRRRTTGASIAERIKHSPGGIAPVAWPLGAQAHIGNDVATGDVYPMIIVRVWNANSVNGQVLLDGNDVLWVTSVAVGDNPGMFSWPTRV